MTAPEWASPIFGGGEKARVQPLPAKANPWWGLLGGKRAKRLLWGLAVKGSPAEESQANPFIEDLLMRLAKRRRSLSWNPDVGDREGTPPWNPNAEPF